VLRQHRGQRQCQRAPRAAFTRRPSTASTRTGCSSPPRAVRR